MTYGGTSVDVSACASLDDRCKISYHIFPEHDTIEFTLGARDELAINTTEAGLRHCIAAFTSALDAFTAAAAQLDATNDNLVPATDPSVDRAG